MNKNAASKARNATPPTTLPAIAPVCELLLLLEVAATVELAAAAAAATEVTTVVCANV